MPWGIICFWSETAEFNPLYRLNGLFDYKGCGKMTHDINVWEIGGKTNLE